MGSERDHPPRPRGRFAPSPTGPVHLGNARTALVAWLSVRARGGEMVYRVEDLDPPRVVAGMAEQQQRDLEWLGLDWDEGPNAGGSHPPYVQAERFGIYAATLRRLERDGRLFPCSLSRRELESIASAPHGREGSPYPASLRPLDVGPGWLERVLAGEVRVDAVRFRVEPGEVRWNDLLLGPQCERVDVEVGDFVLRRRDGLWAYQLAVVVDDVAMAITEVVRGADLLSSTGRQILLFEALGAAPPSFGHVPLLLGPGGQKLSKRARSLTLGSLREAGIPAEQVVGYLAWTLGLRDRVEPVRSRDLIESFSWAAIAREAVLVPDDLAQRLGELPGGIPP
ncbi:MAG TPA: tRNA glutamyl-Q(34) synthetase GluQRS [Thermoanaerobaculia bacterium]|nr:tRNA glutamyl-Q(34) synthetase GluQRS [Thermoanaerobaculia bacterium]